MKVSVICITYNQKPYIAKAIEGILMQKTDFEFEVVINDDASTDGTTEIVKKYAELYPDKIKAVLHTENQFSKGVPFSKILNLETLQGDYIAICEGDDYWTDPKKLQIQADFLDKQKNFSGCFHSSMRKDGNTFDDIRIFPSKKERLYKSIFTIKDIGKGYFIETCSVMYRFKPYKEELISLIPGHIINVDSYLIGYFATKGKFKYIDRVMSVKLISNIGVWNNPEQTIDDRNTRFAYEIVNVAKEYGSMMQKLHMEKYNTFKVSDALPEVLMSLYKNKQSEKISYIIDKFYPSFYQEYKNDKRIFYKIFKRYRRIKNIAFISIAVNIILLICLILGI